MAGSAALGSDIRMEATTTSEAPLQQDGLLRPDQAAWYLNRTSWIYERVRTGRLPCNQVGRHIRVTRAVLDDWLAEQPWLVTPRRSGVQGVSDTHDHDDHIGQAQQVAEPVDTMHELLIGPDCHR
jgi:excisionase family DNA binding protein